MDSAKREDRLRYLAGLEESINRKIADLKEAQENKAKGNLISGLQAEIHARRRQVVKLKRELGIK